MYTLELEMVTKCYGREVVVDDLTFTVHPRASLSAQLEPALGRSR